MAGMLAKIEGLLHDLSEVAEELKASTPDPALEAKRIQLKAICRSIDQLESKDVPVPEELRALKGSLVSEIDNLEGTEHALARLGTGLSKLMSELDQRNSKTQAPRVSKDGPSMSFARPRVLRLKGRPDVQVSTWKEVMKQTCEALLERHPDKVPELETIGGRKRKFFSRSPGSFRSPLKLRSGLYVEAARSANSIFTFLHQVMAACGEPADDLQVEVEQGR
jgi:hypothetical protein